MYNIFPGVRGEVSGLLKPKGCIRRVFSKYHHIPLFRFRGRPILCKIGHFNVTVVLEKRSSGDLNHYDFIFCVPWISAADLMGIGSLVFEISCHEIKCWNKWKIWPAGGTRWGLGVAKNLYRSHRDVVVNYNTTYRCFSPHSVWTGTQHSPFFSCFSAQRNALVYDFNNVFNSGTFVGKQMSTSLKFAFVEHFCTHVVLIIHMTKQRKLSLNLFFIQADLINYTFLHLQVFLSCNVNLTCSEYGTKHSFTSLKICKFTGRICIAVLNVEIINQMYIFFNVCCSFKLKLQLLLSVITSQMQTWDFLIHVWLFSANKNHIALAFCHRGMDVPFSVDTAAHWQIKCLYFTL